jgi:hypothetical protein
MVMLLTPAAAVGAVSTIVIAAVPSPATAIAARRRGRWVMALLIVSFGTAMLTGGRRRNGRLPRRVAVRFVGNSFVTRILHEGRIEHMFENLGSLVFPTPKVVPGRSTTVEEFIEDLARAKVDEIGAETEKVAAAVGLWSLRMEQEAERGGSALTASHATYAEIASLLVCTLSAAKTMVEVGHDLDTRLLMVRSAFRSCKIDYAKVVVISQTLREASAGTIAFIEADVVWAARHMTVGSLRREIWRLWIARAPKEAAEVREGMKKTDRTAYVRRGSGGLSWLSACITAIEGAQADALLDEIADTVCAHDPRSRNTRRADGLMALLHGETMLGCECGSDDCPMVGTESPKRRGFLAQILIDVQNLLGLSANPARLADGTLVDADVARVLAEDATWQAILTEMRAMAEENGFTADEPAAPANDESADTADGFAPDDAGGGLTTDEDARDSDPEAWARWRWRGLALEDAQVSESMMHPYRRVLRAMSNVLEPACAEGQQCASTRYVGRGRARKSGRVLPQTVAACTIPTRGIGTSIEIILDTLTEATRLGIYPDGHGGYAEPPPGALTYRPTAELAALVRAAYPTCVFPGCTVASHKCELDHRVPFNHDRPDAGGWTILSNLQPLCKKHHDVKTAKLWECVGLDGGVVLWTSPERLERVTVPISGMVAFPAPDAAPGASPTTTVSHSDPLTEHEAIELLYEPTWWESFMGDTAPPTLGDLATITDRDHHRRCSYLRDRYREHVNIVSKRLDHAGAPF